MYDRKEEIILSFIVLMLFGLIGLCIRGSIQERKDWDVFAQTHNCEIIKKEKSTVAMSTGITSTGAVGTLGHYVPSKTSYLCSDNVIYVR